MNEFKISKNLAEQFANQIFTDEIKNFIDAHSDEYKKFLAEYQKSIADGR